jgi:MFS family permease
MGSQVVMSAAEGRDANARGESWRLLRLHFIEALMSASSNFLTIGIYFYTREKFGWSLLQNFMLSSGLGTVYVVGALAAHPLSERFGKRTMLVFMYSLIALIALLAAAVPSPVIASITVLVFGSAGAVTWPIIESLFSAGDLDPHEMSRRLSRYNVVWAVVGAVVVALNGLIIEKFPIGVFLFTAGGCIASICIAVLGRLEPVLQPAAPTSAHAAPEPEPALARQRVVALWLSRTSVPAMYIMIYALAAMMPFLPVIRHLSPTWQTAVSSIWLVARWIAFMVLGATVFWHTRPRLLLAASATLLGSLLLITLPHQLALMIAGQIAFGAAAGLIYTASLYFGMVLSEGSTEHGGYHEALIGLGIALGPAVGGGSQWLWPGNQHAAVAAVGTLVGASLLLASIASLRLRRRRG